MIPGANLNDLDFHISGQVDDCKETRAEADEQREQSSQTAASRRGSKDSRMRETRQKLYCYNLKAKPRPTLEK
jgi:hypothetical protein